MVRTVGSALGALFLISSITTSNALSIEKRALTVPPVLPGTWTSKGCYVDVGRTLSDGGYTDNLAMTDESCISYCSTHGYIYAGTEFGQECYCGMSIASTAGTAPTADCSVPCTGNATEPCGGANRLNLFWSGTTGPQTNPGVGLWKFAGCYTEGTTGRTLQVGAGTTGGSGALTVGLCLSACQNLGYNLAGTEYSGECYCDNAISNGGTLAPDGLTGCSMLCNGNFSEYCGGSGRLDIYDYNNAVVLPPWSTTTTVSSSTKPSTTTSKPVTTTATSSTSTKVSTSTSKPSSSSTKSTSTSKPGSTSSTSTSKLSSSSTKSTSTSKVSTSSKSSSSVKSSSTSKSSTSTSKSSSSSSKSSSSTKSTSTSKSSTTTSKSSTSTSSTSTSKSSSSTSSSATSAPTLSHKPTVLGYTFQGCYSEGTGVRALSAAASFDYTAMTLEECATNCAAYAYFGVEYGGECYCGNTLAATSTLQNIADCSFVCPGNSFEYCGAGNRLELYQIGGTGLPTGSSSTNSISTATGTKTGSTTSTTSPPLGTGYPAGWSSQGCWVDGANGRILQHGQQDDPQLTQQSCINTCASLGYSIAGMEWSVQCFCDNFVYNGGALAANQADCNMPCGGNSLQNCGAGNRLTIFATGTPQVFQPPAALQTNLPAGWVYKGCIEDNIPSNEIPDEQLYTFPYKVWDNNLNTPESCMAQCQTFGFNAAGLEYGSQCFCGDVANIAVASAPGTSADPRDPVYLTRSRVPQMLPEAQCDAVCSGDPLHLCGSGNRLTYYAYEASPPLYKWNFPTGTAAGKYELLVGGVVVPLMTAQMVTGKVTFIEKYGSGEPNGTGAYELDLSQASNFNTAWRAMVGLQTDVFCSAGLILPDKAGRQLTIGGWAGESNFGVRLYYPDGSDGVPGTHQWVEDKQHLMLQVPRWYPSAMIMANGSILIVGGEIGSNAAEQPTLEILPSQGVPDTTTLNGYSNTTKYLDFLDRTAPFNLYPFITVLPTGIFIAYYNEARILDEKTFNTIKILPNMPAAVDNPTGGRSYQLEGTMVTLPQVWPYDKNLEVLICGGSTTGGGYAIDNCVTTAPEDTNPTWIIERMPSRRVMPCMAGLPDGTYIIMNGGQHGVAGFGLGDSPNTNAVLYDPSQPHNQRMSILANTTIARLYHSEAIVLLDGRVLVTGSDPTGDYTNPANDYPEEYRVEVFSPSYLLKGGTRPTFTIVNKDWTYGGSITINVVATGTIKVSLLGAVVSTHGNSMGQRTLIPKLTANGGTSYTVLAPPNSHVAPPGWFMLFVVDGNGVPSIGQYIRLGGDPANLGSWPNLPGFQLPGI